MENIIYKIDCGSYFYPCTDKWENFNNLKKKLLEWHLLLHIRAAFRQTHHFFRYFGELLMVVVGRSLKFFIIFHCTVLELGDFSCSKWGDVFSLSAIFS